MWIWVWHCVTLQSHRTWFSCINSHPVCLFHVIFVAQRLSKTWAGGVTVQSFSRGPSCRHQSPEPEVPDCLEKKNVIFSSKSSKKKDSVSTSTCLNSWDNSVLFIYLFITVSYQWLQVLCLKWRPLSAVLPSSCDLFEDFLSGINQKKKKEKTRIKFEELFIIFLEANERKKKS